MKRHAELFLFLTIALWFGVGPISAVTLGEEIDEEFNFSMTPQERLNEWQLALAKFAASKPKLSRGQAEAILALMDIKDPTFFRHNLDREGRQLLAEKLRSFGKLFSYNDVVDFLMPFSNLRHWLIRNHLMSSVTTPVCNCNASWGDCSSGYYCNKNIACISQAGSTSNGVCSPRDLIE